MLTWPWGVIHEAAESLEFAYREAPKMPPGEINPAHLAELAESLGQALADSTDDPKVQAVADLVDSVRRAARLLVADHEAIHKTLGDLREQVTAERAFMKATAAELGSEIARLTVALGEALGHTAKLTAQVEDIAGAGGVS